MQMRFELICFSDSRVACSVARRKARAEPETPDNQPSSPPPVPPRKCFRFCLAFSLPAPRISERKVLSVQQQQTSAMDAATSRLTQRPLSCTQDATHTASRATQTKGVGRSVCCPCWSPAPPPPVTPSLRRRPSVGAGALKSGVILALRAQINPELCSPQSKCFCSPT